MNTIYLDFFNNKKLYLSTFLSKFGIVSEQDKLFCDCVNRNLKGRGLESKITIVMYLDQNILHKYLKNDYFHL